LGKKADGCRFTTAPRKERGSPDGKLAEGSIVLYIMSWLCSLGITWEAEFFGQKRKRGARGKGQAGNEREG